MANDSSLDLLQLLYKDLALKLETVHKYVDAVDSQVGDIYENIYNGVNICKKKYKIVQDYAQSTPKVHPQTEFAIEPKSVRTERPDDQTGQEVQETIEDLNDNLKARFAEINYLFSRQQRNLAMLNNAHLELQGIMNQIFDEWKSLNHDDD